jgi:hypothetical protein
MQAATVAKQEMLQVDRDPNRRSWGTLTRTFSVENSAWAFRKKKGPKKKEKKGRPVETDAADGNPPTTRIPTTA